MVVICSSLNFVFRVILYNATPQFELPRSDPYNTLPSHFTWLPVHRCLSSLLSAGQTLLTLNQWLLRVFPFTGSPPLNFSCPLLSFFYLCHFSFSLNLYVVITISSPVYFTSFSCLSLPSEEEMATHSNILAWEIPWTEEPSGLQSTESQRAGRDFVTKPPSPPPFCVYFLPYLRTHSAHIYIIPQFPLKTYCPLKWPYQIPSHLWAQLHLSVVPLTLFHLERKSLLICYCVRQCVNQ